MSVPKRQHFVPRLYLRRFAPPGGRLFVLDKPQLRVFRQSLNQVASRNYFYDVEVPPSRPDTDKNVVEKTFAKLEGEWATTLGTVLADLGRGKCPSKRSQSELAYFIALQAVRTEEHRLQLVELTTKMQQVTLEARLKLDEQGKFKVGLRPGAVPAIHANYIFGSGILDELTAVFMRHIWLFGRNASQLSFYTSDHPVAKRAHLDGGPMMGFNGLGAPGIEISFPLSPDWVLSLYERSYHRKVEALDRQLLPVQYESVIYCNHLQVRDSTRQVFSIRDDLGFGERVCREQPQVRDLGRPRVSVTGGAGRRPMGPIGPDATPTSRDHDTTLPEG